MATPDSSVRPPLGATLALALALAVAAFAVVMPLALTAIEPVSLGPAFPAQNQRAESLLYALAFLVLLPLALLVGRRLAAALAAGPNAAALSALAALLAAALAVAITAVRAADRLGVAGDGIGTVLAAALAWWVVAGLALARARRPWPALQRLAPHTGRVWALAAAAGAIALLCFVVLGSISLPAAVAGMLVAAAVTAATDRVAPLRVPRPWGRVADVVVFAGVLLLVPDLVIFEPELGAVDPVAGVQAGIIQFHHDFLLGPAREVLDGRPMLRGTASQYGVTSIYAPAAWFLVAPIGYGTFGLFAGALTALWFAAGYAVLRLAGVGRLLAVTALGVAVVTLAYNLSFPVGALPQSGPLRFGLPMVVVLAAVAAARCPAHARLARTAGLAAVGLSSIWAFETFTYTAGVWVVLAAVDAWLAPEGSRLRAAGRAVLAAAAACVAAHVAFALLTLAATGSLPDWGEYVAYLKAFASGDVGDLTYDVARWTPALAVGAGYVASALALGELLLRRDPLVARERPAIAALAGLTAYGVVLLSYYVDRSQDHILIHVALPALLTGTVWLALLRRAPVPLAVRRGGTAAVAMVAALLLAVAWSSVDDRLPRTPLGHAVPGGRSLTAALDRLWHPPAFHPDTADAERVVAAELPGDDAILLVEPDLANEVLMRSGRTDPLALGFAWETSFVARDLAPGVARRVDALAPGTRLVLDGASRDALAQLRADLSIDPLGTVLGSVAPLQVFALQRLLERYDLRPVAREGDLSVVELAPRR